MRIIEVRKRMCGYPKEGGFYISGGETSGDGIMPPFFLLTPPVPYSAKFHRGPRLVQGTRVIARTPIDTWWMGASADHEEKKSADEFWIETFGMTLQKRLTTGSAKGAETANQALEKLVMFLKFDKRILDIYRSLTVHGIQEYKKVLPHYNKFFELLASFTRKEDVASLLGMVAETWQMAYNLPPIKRVDFVPDLVRILYMLGLQEDAKALATTFQGRY